MKKYLNTPEEVIKVLKEGKGVRLEEGGAGVVKLIDGLCVKQWQDQFNINYTINLRDKPFIEEAEPLNVELGKFYKMRDGKKAMAGFVGPRSILVVCQEDGDTVWLNKNGKSNVGERPWEIIGEWED